MFVCGSFDNWTRRHALQWDETKQVFSTLVNVQGHDGEEVWYKFIVDGEWQVSENDAIATDACGNVNNVATMERDITIVAVTGSGTVTDDESIVMVSGAPSYSYSDGESQFTDVGADLSELCDDEEIIDSVAIVAEPQFDETSSMGTSVQLTIQDRDRDNISITETTSVLSRTSKSHGNKGHGKKTHSHGAGQDKSYTLVGRIRSIFGGIDY